MTTRLLLSAILAGPILAASAQAAEIKVTFNDQVLPIFKNACLNCHNPDKKKAGLDLSTYQGALAGSDNGKVVESGSPDKSLLLKTVKHIEEPKMPPKGDKLTDADIAMLEKWVAGQLLESGTSKAVAPTNNVQLTVVSLDRPAGPPPMPAIDLPLEPLVRTKTSNALVALAASPWAPLVAVGGQKQIVLYNSETLQTLGILPFPEGFPAVVKFSRNGQLLLTGGGLGGKSGKVVLWKVETGERIGQVGDEFDQVLGADISPDHAHVALGGPTKILKIFSTKDGKLVESIKKHTDWITAVSFSPDGRYLASADRNGGIEVWEGATGKPYSSLPGHKAMVTALAFMPGVLASAGEDGRISLWDVKEGKEIRGWVAHAGGVTSVDFTPDGRLVSSGRDKLAKAWDQTGKALLTSQPFADIALRAVLNSDRVIAGDWTGQIRVFNLADGKPLGELTANPPLIAESLAAAEKLVTDRTAELKAQEAAVAAAQAKLQAEVAALQTKRQAEVAALEAKKKQSQAALDALKAVPQAVEKQLLAGRETVKALTQVRDTKADAERVEAQAKLDAQAKKVADDEALLKKAQADLAARSPALSKQLDETTAALAALAKQPVKLVPTPASIAAADAAAKRAEAVRKELPPLVAERAKHKGGTPPYAAADARVNAKQQQVNQADAAFAAAKAAAASAPVEQELAKAQAALAQAQAQLPLATADLNRWKRAQAYMTVHRAKQSLGELKNKHDGLVAAVKDALAPAEKIQAEIAAAEKQAATAAGAVKEQEAATAKLRADLETAKKAIASAQAALTAAEARAKTPPAGAPAAPNEVAASKAELAKHQQAAKDLEAKAAEAAKLVEAGKKLGETAAGKVAELRKKAAAVTEEAKVAKAKAEQEAAAAAKELEAAKAQADRVRADYEKQYRVQQDGKPATVAKAGA